MDQERSFSFSLMQWLSEVRPRRVHKSPYFCFIINFYLPFRDRPDIALEMFSNESGKRSRS